MLYLRLKRLLDIIISFFCFLILSPLLLLIVLLILIFDPGPIIFKQLRIGKNLKPFVFYKFRTMPIDTKNIPSDKLGKVKIKIVGKLLRRLNLDELPQLLNIFKGDMSFVGPRPCLPSQKRLIERRKENSSCLITPGLTGLAQVNSFNGMDFASKANFDKLYSQNISLKGDIVIIFKTILYLFKEPPTY